MWPLQTLLAGGIWHTTHPERFPSIMNEGLKPDPDIPDSERWKTADGPEYFPFVRKLGGVSLFDLMDFDPDAYDQSHKLSSWRTFIPHRKDWEGAVWINIDCNVLGSNFVSADDLVHQWHDGGHHKNTIMPRIECASIGGVPRSMFRSCFMVWSYGDEVRDLSIENFNESEYRAVLDEWRVATSQSSAG